MYKPAYQLPPNPYSELESVERFLPGLRADAQSSDPVRARTGRAVARLHEERRLQLLREIAELGRLR